MPQTTILALGTSVASSTDVTLASGADARVGLFAGLTTPVNAAFTTSTTGGSLAAGTYYYRVSALDKHGETLASTETSQVTTGATSTVTVNWGAVTGATGYKVYGRSTGAQQLLATVGAVTTYVDTGAVTPSGALPGRNTTGAVPQDALATVVMATPRGDIALGQLTGGNNTAMIAGPGTFRVVRVSAGGDAGIGVFSDT